MKQTAVEWLEEQLDIRNKSDGMIWHFQKAKEMEKAKAIKFAKEFYELFTQKEIANHVVEVIYNETFKSE
jgi:hypothetical protein